MLNCYLKKAQKHFHKMILMRLMYDISLTIVYNFNIIMINNCEQFSTNTHIKIEGRWKCSARKYFSIDKSHYHHHIITLVCFHVQFSHIICISLPLLLCFALCLHTKKSINWILCIFCDPLSLLLLVFCVSFRVCVRVTLNQ